jgi:Tol biopolymer transport system component
MDKIVYFLAAVLVVTLLLPAATASSANVTRLTNDSAVSRQPDIAVSGNYTYVVWSDDRDGNYEIYYKMLDDSSVSVSDTRLTNSGASSITPSVAVDTADEVHVVWREGDDIYYLKADSIGTLLISPKQISDVNTGRYMQHSQRLAIDQRELDCQVMKIWL